MKKFDENWKKLLIDNLEKSGVSITDDQAEKLKIYGNELVLWNNKKNLTSITDPEEIAYLHFIDSLLITGDIEKDGVKGKKLLDTGTGGGFPGIPLKIFFPELDITLLDSSRKKVSFLKYISRELGLKSIKAVNERAEVFSRENSETFDYITSRAFTSVESFFNMVWPALKKDGKIIAMKGPETDDELAELKGGSYEFQGKNVEGKDLDIDIREYMVPVVNHERKIISLTHLYNVK